MAAGVPVLASRIGGIPEILQDGVTGAAVSTRFRDDLRAKAARLFEDADLNRTLGLNARAEYESRYSPQANLRALLDIYAGVVRRP